MGSLFNSGHGMVTATLTETVNMPGYVTPTATNTMVVFPDKSSIPADGSPINVNVRAGGNYTVEPSETWVHYQKYEHGLTLFADPNANNGVRNFTVTLTLDSDNTQQVVLSLTQGTLPETGFSVSPGLDVVSAFGSDAEPIQLNAAGPWQAETLNDYMIVYGVDDKLCYVGRNSDALLVKVKPNYTGEVRKGVVRFYGNGEATYTVIQNPAPFSVSAESLSFEKDGGSQTIKLTPVLGDSMPRVTVSSTVEGITATEANGVVTVTATANTTTTERSGHIDIALSAVDVAVIPVTQAGA